MTKEPVYAREYVHAASAGDDVACKTAFESVDEYVARLYVDRRIEGFDLMIMHDEEECMEELLHDEWKSVAGEVYPFVYLLLQPFQSPNGMDPEVERYVTQNGFVRFR